MDIAFSAIIFVVLTLAGFFSLRWTTLDPQFPKAQASWKVWGKSAVAAALVMLSYPGAPSGVLTASFAFGMITKSAILPPVEISAEETPQFWQRVWRGWSSDALGGLLQALVVGAGTLILSWFPVFDDLPVWFGCYAFACIFSTGTRPISRPVDPRRVNRRALTDFDTSAETARKRLLAVVAIGIWLLVAFPAIEYTLDPSMDQTAVLAAIFAGALLVDRA